MKILAMIGILVAVCTCRVFPAIAQSKPPSDQQAGDCSVNIAGNGNTASLICDGIDVNLAKQIRAILSGTSRNERTTKEISEKLDRIIMQMDQEGTPPQVGLRFVYPKAPGPALVIVNQSAVVARDIKWTVALWNMDLPDRDDPLPIPVTSFDWIKGNDEGGPNDLFSSPQVATLLKPGNRLFGSASVSCSTCVRGRTYIIYIVWGEGGWVAELENEKSGRVFLPINFSKETRMGYFKELEAKIPANSRIPIGDYSPKK